MRLFDLSISTIWLKLISGGTSSIMLSPSSGLFIPNRSRIPFHINIPSITETDTTIHSHINLNRQPFFPAFSLRRAFSCFLYSFIALRSALSILYFCSWLEKLEISREGSSSLLSTTARSSPSKTSSEEFSLFIWSASVYL